MVEKNQETVINTLNYTYDALGEINTTTLGTFGVTYSRQAGFINVSSREIKQNGVVKMTSTFAYDAQHRLVSIAGDNANQRVKTLSHNDSTWKYTYKNKITLKNIGQGWSSYFNSPTWASMNNLNLKNGEFFTQPHKGGNDFRIFFSEPNTNKIPEECRCNVK